MTVEVVRRKQPKLFEHSLYLGPELTREERDLGLRLSVALNRRDATKLARDVYVQKASEAAAACAEAERELASLLTEMRDVEKRLGRDVLIGPAWAEEDQ